ncbi:MAG: hypothetical protein HY774_25670 [Acidobacteria bacterium]|nr:hypothetical protein [Acidobacteriota bacterium]
MKSKLQVVFLLCLLGSSLIIFPTQSVRACGPFYDEARFVFTKHPDHPLHRFAQGELNVLQPGYAWSYLIVAYRYFNGIGLDETEQKAAVGKWETRLGITDESKPDYWLNQWLEARKKVTGITSPPTISQYVKEDESYSYQIAITGDAFHLATQTLAERINQFGASSPQVREWLKAQDQVFQTASGETSIPDAAPASVDPMIKADRAYQIAAANFYGNNYEAALAGFDQIANDTNSPWKIIAPYLAIRTLYRQYENQDQNTPQQDAAILSDARDRCTKLLADAQLSEYHPATRRLVADIQYGQIAIELGIPDSEYLTPAQFQAQFVVLEQLTLDEAQDLLRPHSGPAFGRNLWNFPDHLDNIIEATADENDPVDVVDYDRVKRTFESLPAIRLKDDLIDWILVFQTMDNPASDYATQTWEKTRKLHWLCSALSKTTGNAPKLAALLSAAEQVPADSPAYPMVSYHRIRLLIEAGKLDDARKLLAEFMPTRGTSLTQSSWNLFSQLQMQAATGLPELTKFISRRPAGIVEAYDYYQISAEFGSNYSDSPESVKYRQERLEKEKQPLFDTPASRILNQGLPLSLLGEIIQNSTLPKHLRRDLAMVVWVKAGLLENRKIATRASRVVGKLVPELKNLTAAYRSSKSSAKARFALIFAVLRFPGLRPHIVAGVPRPKRLSKIDGHRDNWWCAFDTRGEVSAQSYEKYNGNGLNEEYGPDGSPLPQPPFDPAKAFYPPAFLTTSQKEAAFDEWKALVAIGTAPNYLCRQTIDFARKYPRDPHVPEALHLAVRSTRYGSTDDTTTDFSKEAFLLLKKKYPRTHWAQKTKYYF